MSGKHGTTTLAGPQAGSWRLPRTPREKSYSARICESADLLARFFIRFSFSSAGASGADHADIISPFRVDDNQQFSLIRTSDDNEPVFGLGMSRIGNRQ